MELEPNRPVYDWPLGRGQTGNEVWFVVCTSRDGDVSFWYHVEMVSTANREAGRAWAAVQDRARGTKLFTVTSIDPADLHLGTRPFALASADHRLTSQSLTGHIDGETDISWSLEWEPDTYAYTPMRSRFLTNLLATVAGTGTYWSRNNSIDITGTLEIGDRTIDLEAAPGCQGHIVPPRSPKPITWLHCNHFETGGASASSVAIEALQLGPFCSAVLRVDDRTYEFNRLWHLLPVGPRSNTVTQNEVGTWRFRADDGTAAIRVSVETDSNFWHRATGYTRAGEPLYVAHSPFGRVTLEYVTETDWTTVTSDTGRVEWYRDRPPVPGNFQPDWHV